MSTLPTKVAVPTDPMAGIASLLTTLGGTKTTTNAGETDVLRSAVADLKGTDYEALLTSIFQKAAGEIPGIQHAFGNAVGARSGSNSAVAAALQQLLKDTTVGAQGQIATQKLNNSNLQINAGNSIAQATKGTTQQSGTNVGQAAKTMAVLQMLSKAANMTGLDKKLGSLFSESAATPGSPLTSAYAPVASPWADVSPASSAALTSTPFSSQMYSAQSPDPTVFSGFTPGVSNAVSAIPGAGTDAADFAQLDFSPLTGAGTDLADFAQLDFSPVADVANSVADFSALDFTDLFGFADGGLVTPTGNSRGYNPLAAPLPTRMVVDNTPGMAISTPAPTLAPAPVKIPVQRPNVPYTDASGQGYGTANNVGNPNGTVTSQGLALVANALIGTLGPVGKVVNLGLTALGKPTIGKSIADAILGPPAAAAGPGNTAAPTGSVSVGDISVDSMDGVATPGLSVPGLDSMAAAVADAVSGASSGDSSGASAAGAGAASASDGNGGGPGWANGGTVQGKGTGTSDSIDIKASDGEYVMSDDVVEMLGVDFFDALQAAFHTPVAHRGAQQGAR